MAKRRLRGAYILILKKEEDENLQIGKLGNFYFKKGFYAYVGSALKGYSRVDRHIEVSNGMNNTRRWHIDYLLSRSKVDSAILIPTDENIECKISSSLEKKDMEMIYGFGCTDCICNSHLYYSNEDIRNLIAETCEKFGKIIIRTNNKNK